MYEKDISSRKLSAVTGISKSTINRIASGAVSPTADTLEALAKGLKIRISDLYESDFK